MNDEMQQQLEEIISSYEPDRRYALAAMQDMQRAFNYVPEEGIVALAKHLGTSAISLYSMATFYKALSLKPKGEHIIKVCNGTACHLRGSTNLITGIERELGIAPGDVTEDGKFSVELVNCLGSCALAPVFVVDDDIYGKVRLEQIPKILDAYRDDERGGRR
jgi:NADH:ubiquinone oxidoreductase subunit E